jgi:putative ABC transport system permease protein
MNIIELVRTALESLWSNKMRSLLTMLGVIIGVASVVALLAIGGGVSDSISDQIQGIGSNLLTISPDQKVANARLTTDDVAALSDKAAVPGVKRIVPVVNGNLNVAAGANNKTVSVSGTTPEFFSMKNIKTASGELFKQADVETRNRVVVLGSSLYGRLFPSGNGIGQNVLIGSVTFKVVGVAEKVGGAGPGGNTDETAYVPMTVASEKLFVNRAGGVKSVSQINVEMVDSNQGTSVSGAVEKALRKQHNLLVGQENDFQVFDQAQIAGTLNTITTLLTAFLGIIGGISLLVGGIGIMNIMLVSVTERTREIGVRKAIGARDGSIRMQFLIEALTVTGIAGVIGIGAGVGIAALVSATGLLQASVQTSTILVAFGVSVAVGVIFGLYPAWRASLLEPVEALRYE